MNAVKCFKFPEQTFREFDDDTAAALVAAVADVALVIDRQGVVQDMALDCEQLPLAGGDGWLGRHWRETVTVESRAKVEELLRDAMRKAPPRWRQLNHPAAHGEADVPILYSAIRMGRSGERIMAIGRDLRAMAMLQQRLVDAQQAMEQDYERLRYAETRYRMLFQMASEAVMILDATTLKIVEVNPAAGKLLGESTTSLTGRPLSRVFDTASTRVVQSLLATVRATGRADDIRLESVDGRQTFTVSASLFRQRNGAHLLVRLMPVDPQQSAPAIPENRRATLAVIDGLPDGFVVTDPDGVIIAANRAFLDLVQLVTEEQIKGMSLARWLGVPGPGRPGVDLGVLLSNLRQHGSVRLFITSLQGEYGSTVDVEISAVSVPRADQPCCGFVIRHVGQRLNHRRSRELPRSVEQMTELVGRVSLKELVRETTDMIERLCIEAALELTGDNRASAAELLGLSRQSLYVKLRRYGLGDLDVEGEGNGRRQ